MAEGLLAGKRGVVFGVANEKSIAWGCAQACAAQGASLAFNYLGEQLERRVRKLVDEFLPGSPVFNCNVQSDDEIAAFFASVKKEWDTIDFVIHSVAFADREDLKDQYITTPRANFALALNISAYSLVALAREAAPMMPNGGSIVAMTYYGAEKVVPRYNVMGVAKAALECSARYLANDLGPKGIRVNCISAGPIKTLSASAIAGMRGMLTAAEKVAPMRRNVSQTDVGQTTVFLLSDHSSAITGEVIHVDSGYHVMGLFGFEDLANGGEK
ncbi:MAG: enoyl-ACP reductase [Candidatus Hydrogenedentes bacterium]|nr:enoyl-ACP reductase [Candidatus Hydrogenedentota bacterium]